jgi:serine/threonine protein kinase
MPEEIVGNCAMQCVKGLHYLHKERRIIHRDIKPSNILVNSVGEFKITDFGMSKELSSALSAGQTWIGTNQYMSPERVGGLDYSFNADVWSLGLLLYQCATGHQPYQGSNTFELLDQIVDGEPPALPAGTFTNEASPHSQTLSH